MSSCLRRPRDWCGVGLIVLGLGLVVGEAHGAPNPVGDAPNSTNQPAPMGGAEVSGGSTAPTQSSGQDAGPNQGVETSVGSGSAEDPRWEERFGVARQLLSAGDFSRAATEFGVLRASASTPTARARAVELEGLSQSWARSHMALVRGSELEGSDLLARRTDHRTSDEIGVLYLSSIVYGLGTGLAFDVATEPESVAAVVLPPLMLGGLAAGGVALLDSGQGLRYGAAQSIASGMSVGLWNGIAWTTYYQATTSREDQLDEPAYVGILWASATAGAVAGGAIGAYRSTTPGRAALVSSASMWSGLALGLGGASVGADDDRLDDRALLMGAVGVTGGMIGGMVAAGPVSPTTARVRFLDIGGVAGGLAVGGLWLAAQGEHTNPQSALLVTDLGMVGGLGLAWWLTSNMPRDLGSEARRPSPSPVASIQPRLLPLRGGMGIGVGGMLE